MNFQFSPSQEKLPGARQTAQKKSYNLPFDQSSTKDFNYGQRTGDFSDPRYRRRPMTTNTQANNVRMLYKRGQDNPSILTSAHMPHDSQGPENMLQSIDSTKDKIMVANYEIN